MPKNIVALLDNPDCKAVIRRACEENDLYFAEFEELVHAEIQQTGKQRKKGLWDSFDDILDRIIQEDK